MGDRPGWGVLMMMDILKSSLAYKAVDGLYGLYQYSLLHRAACTMSAWYKSSSYYGWLEKYLTHASTHPHSVFYRILGTAGRKADSGVQYAYDTLNKASWMSMGISLYKNLLSEMQHSLYKLLITFLLGIAGGYAALVTVQGVWDVQKLLYVAVAAFACLVLFLVKDSWKCWVGNSLLNKLYQYILK
jgi:hypothetical protein